MSLKGQEREYIIRLAAETGAQAALKAYKEESERIKAENADRRLRNTKLLLRNYRMFKAHAENAVYSAQEVDEDAYDIIDLMSDRYSDSEMFVESIKEKSAAVEVYTCLAAGCKEIRPSSVFMSRMRNFRASKTL